MNEILTEAERRRRRELLARMIEDLDRRGPQHRPLTESDVSDRSKELTEHQGLELLTPLAACDLFAKTAPTVRRAVAEGLVYSPFALNVTGKPVRLIDLRSAIAYWGPPGARRLDEMRTNGNLLRIEVLDYNILHPEPLVTATDPHEEDTRE